MGLGSSQILPLLSDPTAQFISAGLTGRALCSRFSLFQFRRRAGQSCCSNKLNESFFASRFCGSSAMARSERLACADRIWRGHQNVPGLGAAHPHVRPSQNLRFEFSPAHLKIFGRFHIVTGRGNSSYPSIRSCLPSGAGSPASKPQRTNIVRALINSLARRKTSEELRAFPRPTMRPRTAAYSARGAAFNWVLRRPNHFCASLFDLLTLECRQPVWQKPALLAVPALICSGFCTGAGPCGSPGFRDCLR